VFQGNEVGGTALFFVNGVSKKMGIVEIVF
jgi:hypothetical protein